MALSPLPTSADLSTFSHGETDVFTGPQRVQAIDQAAVLLWIATRIENYTADETIDKIIRWAILDMAWSLLVKTENKTASNSGFNSERIGSYSYSIAMSRVQSSQPTGVNWFDAAVTLLLGEFDLGAVWSVSENVFSQPYEPDCNGIYPLHDPCGDVVWVDGGTV